MSMKRKLSAYGGVLFALILMSATLLAQDFRGSLTGRVTEASGAAVPNATVTITNLATNTSSSATTDDSGAYSLLYITSGNYRVTVEAKGFKKAVRDDVTVRIGDKLELGFALEVGAVTDSVNITSEAPLLEANSYLATNLEEIERSAADAMQIVQENLSHLRPIRIEPVRIAARK